MIIGAAVLAVGLVPLAIWLSYRLSLRKSGDGTTFRPVAVMRAIYPAMLAVGGWGVLFYVCLFVTKADATNGWDLLGLAGMVALTVIDVATWPATIKVRGEGLHFCRMLNTATIPWDAIDDAVIATDGELVIYADGRQYHLSPFTEGRFELRDLIRGHLHHTRIGT